MKKKTNRYSVPNDEGFEAGSNKQVLKNYLGIKSKEQIEIIEVQELERVETELVEFFDQDHQFTAKDICLIHKK